MAVIGSIIVVIIGVTLGLKLGGSPPFRSRWKASGPLSEEGTDFLDSQLDLSDLAAIECRGKIVQATGCVIDPLVTIAGPIADDDPPMVAKPIGSPRRHARAIAVIAMLFPILFIMMMRSPTAEHGTRSPLATLGDGASTRPSAGKATTQPTKDSQPATTAPSSKAEPQFNYILTNAADRPPTTAARAEVPTTMPATKTPAAPPLAAAPQPAAATRPADHESDAEDIGGGEKDGVKLVVSWPPLAQMPDAVKALHIRLLALRDGELVGEIQFLEDGYARIGSYNGRIENLSLSTRHIRPAHLGLEGACDWILLVMPSDSIARFEQFKAQALERSGGASRVQVIRAKLAQTNGAWSPVLIGTEQREKGWKS